MKSYPAKENLSHASNAHIYGYLGVRIPLYGTSIYQMNEIPFLSSEFNHLRVCDKIQKMVSIS